MGKTSNTESANPIIGTPDSDSVMFPGQQSYADTCAIRCQEFILEMFTGQDIPEDQLVQEAAANGWYNPGGGTSMNDVGNILELHGIAVNRYENANMFNLVDELAQGHKVMIGVDSEDLWQQNPILNDMNHALGLNQADHAVVVSGIDTSNPDDIRVIISDPGTGEAAASYPMNDFMEAWKDSNFFMVATQDPAPEGLPEMANFDYDTGHIEQVGDISYGDFMEYAEKPDQWDQLFARLFGEDDNLNDNDQENFAEECWREIDANDELEDSWSDFDDDIIDDNDDY